MIVTRFAPSPNGSLHLGHAYSAITAHDLAAGGRFVLRIEDIDGERSRAHFADEARADLAWLGLTWEEVAAQSTRAAQYTQAAQALRAAGLLYRCACTRSQIIAATQTQDETQGEDGPLYPGTCRREPPDPRLPAAWRLDVAEAMRRTGPLTWYDVTAGEQQARPDLFGDVVLVRKDQATLASYHLAATLDDAADGITLVTRGADLFAATHIHRLLQALLNLPVPRWHHHGLLVEADGQKLAKRRGSPSLSALRRAGVDGRTLGQDLREQVFPSGIRLVPGLFPIP